MEKSFSKLFVGGDLSGIQKFLYNISCSKAAVSLIGRSAYLNDFMKKACTELKKDLPEEGTEELYSSGGKFYLITANTGEARHIIDEHARAHQRELWEQHKGILGFSMCAVPFNELPDGRYEVEGEVSDKPGLLWKKASEEFFRQKNQKFKAELVADFDDYFEPIRVDFKAEVCAVTGIESSDCVHVKGSDDEDLYVLPSVCDQIKLGEKVREERNFKTFEEYADGSFLGILRMDVDGLGKRFIAGFESLADYRKFSNRLVEFFEKEVLKMQKDDAFRENMNIIYAGGDDLFAVGRWDKVIEFAKKVHDETAKCFSRDGISISGGVVVVKEKFPIGKAAILAGEAEDAAKRFNNGQKNAFSMFGRVVAWDGEFGEVERYKDEFVRMIRSSNPPLSKSILHKLMLYSSIAEQNEQNEREGKKADFSYVWHLPYYLTRYMKRYSGNTEVQGFCRKLRDTDFLKDKRRLQLIALAARWAELLLREKQGNNNSILYCHE